MCASYIYKYIVQSFQCAIFFSLFHIRIFFYIYFYEKKKSTATSISPSYCLSLSLSSLPIYLYLFLFPSHSYTCTLCLMGSDKISKVKKVIFLSFLFLAFQLKIFFPNAYDIYLLFVICIYLYK